MQRVAGLFTHTLDNQSPVIVLTGTGDEYIGRSHDAADDCPHGSLPALNAPR
jgi:hypothetical protein